MLLAGTSQAAQRFWNGAGSEEVPPNYDFSAATNWFNGLVPIAGEDAVIRGHSTPAYASHAIMTNSWNLTNIRIGGEGSGSTEGVPTLTLNAGADLTWSNALDIGYSLVNDTNAPAAYGILEINAGDHDGVTMNIGKAAGTSPWATTGEVTIANATLNLTGATKIATRDGSATGATVGTLTLNTGAVVNASNSAGSYTVTVGDFGSGKLIINGGTLNFAAGKALRLGENGGDGTVELNSGLLNLGVHPGVGSGTGLIDIKEGLFMISDGAWRKAQMEALVNDGTITASGGGSLAQDAIYSALYTAGTGSTNISTYITLKWGITGSDPRTNAMWAVDTTPPPGTRLTIGFEGDGWPGGYIPTLTTEISIDGAGTVSSANSNITVTLSGNPLPTNLYNTSFIYDVNGQSDLNEVTGLGASAAGLSITTANDSIVTGSGIRNAAGDTALITHELDPGGLPSGFDIELWEIETRILGASEVATFIDLVNPTNRLSVAGDGNTLQPNDVTGLDIAIDSSSSETAFVSMCALTNDAATSYRLQTLTLNLVEQGDEPAAEGTYEFWMEPYTGVLTNSALQAKDADPDEDDLDNLMEFALGGNPTTNDAAAILPTSSVEGSSLQYLYNRRTNHVEIGLSYYLELTPDLVNTAFTNDTAAYTVDGVSAAVGGFEMVTNSINTVTDAKFVTLTVEE